MALEDLAIALGGVQQGMDLTFQKRQAMEDADNERKRLATERALREQELKFRKDSDDFRTASLEGQSQVNMAAGKEATSTVDAAIDATNAKSRASAIGSELDADTDMARMAAGAARDVAATESSKRGAVQAAAGLSEATDEARLASGAARDVARTEASGRSQERQQDRRQIDEDQVVLDEVATNRMNNVYGNKAVADKHLAIAQRRSAEVQTSLVKARQQSNFDLNRFALEQQDQMLDLSVMAYDQAKFGNTKQALDIIDLDRNSDGVGDFADAGAVGVQVAMVNGKEMMAAVDKEGVPVIDPDTGEPALFEVGALKSAMDNRARGGKIDSSLQTAAATAAARAGKAVKPLTIKDVGEIDNIVDASISQDWGMDPDDTGEYALDRFVAPSLLDKPIAVNRVVTDPTTGERRNEQVEIAPNGQALFTNTLTQIEQDMRLAVAREAGTSGTIAGITPKFNSLPSTMRAVYPLIPAQLMDAALERGAEAAALEANVVGQERESFVQNIVRGFGMGKNYEAMPESIQQHVNAEYLKLAALHQKQLADRNR